MTFIIEHKTIIVNLNPNLIAFIGSLHFIQNYICLFRTSLTRLLTSPSICLCILYQEIENLRISIIVKTGKQRHISQYMYKK